MPLSRLFIILPIAFQAACGHAKQDAGFVEGFEPPAPSPGQTQYVTPALHVSGGADVLLCSYLTAEVSADADVVDFSGSASSGSHHAFLYGVKIKQPVGTHVCKNEEMVNTQLIAGIGGDGGAAIGGMLPPGFARRVTAHTQIMIQSHWVNARETAIDGQAAFNVTLAPHSNDLIPTDLMFVMQTTFSLPARGSTQVSTNCTFDQDVNVWELTGHEHELGKHITIVHQPTDAPSTVLFDSDWRPNLTFEVKWNVYVPNPLVIHRGDTLEVTCDWDNPGDHDVAFPAEMCGALIQYYPSDGQRLCFDGMWL
jgi:hypothetical protein